MKILRDPVWTFIGVVVAIISTVAVIIWQSSTSATVNHLQTTPTPTSTPSSTSITSSPIATAQLSPSNTSIPISSPAPKSSFACQSGTLCPFSIVITNVAIVGFSKSTWSFQITNTSTQKMDGYLQKVSIGEWNTYGDVLHLSPGIMQKISVTFPSYAPGNGDFADVTLEFLTSSSREIFYSETCTYSASLQTCQ